MQNAEELAENYPDYVRLVTGIGREEVYARATAIPTSQAERAAAEPPLPEFLLHANHVSQQFRSFRC